MAESDLTLFQAQWNDWIAQGVGEEMMDMGPEEGRTAINRYPDKGPDFIKDGGSSHFRTPSLIGFSPRVQKVIVEESHKRGRIAETHATSPEALRMSVERQPEQSVDTSIPLTTAVGKEARSGDDHRPVSTQDEFGDNLPIAKISKTVLGNLIAELKNGQRSRQLNSGNTRVILPSDTSSLSAKIKPSFLGSVTK